MDQQIAALLALRLQAATETLGISFLLKGPTINQTVDGLWKETIGRSSAAPRTLTFRAFLKSRARKRSKRFFSTPTDWRQRLM